MPNSCSPAGRPAFKPSPSAADQIDRFKGLARELGCDEDEAVCEEALKKVAAPPRQPKHEAKKRKPKGDHRNAGGDTLRTRGAAFRR